MIQGGTELSAYASNCRLSIERRTIPGETEAQVIGEMQTIIDRLAAADPTFNARVRSLFVRNPFEISAKTGIAQAIDQATTAVLGQQPARIGETYWADAALLAEAGIETVMIGPIGAGAHAKEEWVDLQSLLDLAQILAQTAINYCR
jgi:acetylornithine deacetylase